MIDADGAQRAREWLERQLAELGQLRNATRRDPTFKNWRQQTLTVIQRIWPGDTRRCERFRRIPFTPPTAHANERQVREFYERGWGEAGILLRELLAEINLLGLPQARPAGYAAAEPAAEHAPVLDLAGPPAALPATSEPAGDEGNPDDIGRAMERLLGRAPLFRRPARPAPADERVPEPLSLPPPEPAFPVDDLRRLAGSLEAMGLAPEAEAAARRALLALADAAAAGPPDWELVREALTCSGASPGLARRALPLLLELVARAA